MRTQFSPLKKTKYRITPMGCMIQDTATSLRSGVMVAVLKIWEMAKPTLITLKKMKQLHLMQLE